MSMLINEVISARSILKNLVQEKLPIKLSYQIANFLSKTDNDEAFYWEKVRDVIQDCGQKDENGEFKMNEAGNILIIPERTKECTERVGEIEKIEVDISLNLTEDDIMSLDGKVELTPMEVRGLLGLIKGE